MRGVHWLGLGFPEFKDSFIAALRLRILICSGCTLGILLVGKYSSKKENQ